MSPGRTIANDSFDAGVPYAAETANGRRPRVRKTVRATFHLTNEVYDQVRDAVVALSGPPHRMTLASFAEGALRREIERLEREENGGRPFPRRGAEIRRGRPIEA